LNTYFKKASLVGRGKLHPNSTEIYFTQTAKDQKKEKSKKNKEKQKIETP
jgi:hypothetical protein